MQAGPGSAAAAAAAAYERNTALHTAAAHQTCLHLLAADGRLKCIHIVGVVALGECIVLQQGAVGLRSIRDEDLQGVGQRWHGLASAGTATACMLHQQGRQGLHDASAGQQEVARGTSRDCSEP